MGLDLVEISPKADPPVCRIVELLRNSFTSRKKKAKEIKSKIVKVVVKEIRFGPNTDDHDYDFKLKHAENFLKEGAKVKAYVFFSGRQIVFKDQGEILLLRFATDLEELGQSGADAASGGEKDDSDPRSEAEKVNGPHAPKHRNPPGKLSGRVRHTGSHPDSRFRPRRN